MTVTAVRIPSFWGGNASPPSCSTGNIKVPLHVTTRHAPAKINWTLRVLGRRGDGFHEIESLVSTVSLYDTLAFSPADRPGFHLSCDLAGLCVDDDNLVCKAARALGEAVGRQLSFNCHLSKRIPMGGGLGGGSSNAACTLKALDALWSLRWSNQRLAELGAGLGSDVALFVYGGTTVMSGRGELVRPASIRFAGWVVLLIPAFPVATGPVYEAWKPVDHQTQKGPAEAVTAVNLMQQTYNDLERPACEVCPELGVTQRTAADLAGRPVRVSGSGSTLFTAFDSQEEATAFASRAGRRLGVRAEVVRPIGPAG